MKVGAVPSGGFHVFTNPNTDRKRNYVTIAPLKGPDGVQHAQWWPYQPVQPGNFVITSASKNPEIALKWADHFFNKDVTIRGRYGEPGTDWVEAEAGTIGANGKPALFKPILKWGSVQNSHWVFRQPGYLTDQWIMGEIFGGDEYNLSYALAKASIDNYMPHVPPKAEVFPPIFMTNEEAEENADLFRTIWDYARESLARFITGDLDINAEWDNYVAEIDKMGLERMLELNQAAYDRQWK